MPLQYIDLSEKHGHRDDHGFSCGAEFNVKTRRRVDIPEFVREQLAQVQIDDMWWTEAERSRDSLRDTLQRRYKWIGAMTFVGRGPGWLAIEDTVCRARNWDAIGKIVEKHLKEFIASMEDPRFWTEVANVPAKAEGARHHATRKSSSKSPAQLDREISEALSHAPSRRSVAPAPRDRRHHSSMSDDEKIRAAIARFPATFGLRGFPGDVFRLSPAASYVDGQRVVLYTQRKDGNQWLDFAKGSESELRREVTS